MRFVKYMLAFLCLLFPSVAYAEVITLEAALKSAEVNNTDIAIARINLETAIRNSSVYSSYIPDISIDGSLSLDDMSAFGGSWGNLGGNLSLSISLDLGTDLITENALEKLERGGVVYGPEQLTQSQFLSYWQSALDQQVEDYFYQHAQPEGADLEDYYEQHREELDSRNFTAEVDFYYWPREQSISDTQSMLAQILARGAQGAEAAAELQGMGLEASYRHAAINTREMGKEDQAYIQVVELVRNAEDGLLAGCLYAGDMEVWVVPVSRQNESIGTFEEAEEEIEDLWRTEEASRLIDERLSDIEMTTTDAYGRLTIDQIRP